VNYAVSTQLPKKARAPSTGVWAVVLVGDVGAAGYGQVEECDGIGCWRTQGRAAPSSCLGGGPVRYVDRSSDQGCIHALKAARRALACVVATATTGVCTVVSIARKG
jgi:hypothetical protein